MNRIEPLNAPENEQVTSLEEQRPPERQKESLSLQSALITEVREKVIDWSRIISC